MESLARSLAACPPDEEAEGDEHPIVERPRAATYMPLPYQRAFHEAPERFKAAICGLGAGKTSLGTMEALYQAWMVLGDTKHVGIVGAPTYRMIRDVLLPSFQLMWPPELLRGGSWATAFRSQEMVLHLVTGSAVFFRSLAAGRHERLRGIEDVAWLWIDEAALLADERPWQVALGRLRHATARRRSAWITTTPRGENWVATQFVLEPLPGYMAVRARSRDNPALPPDYLESQYATLSARQAAQELEGEILSIEGAVYPDLSRQEWPAGNLVVRSPDKSAPTWVAVDFGRLHPRAILIQQLALRGAERSIVAADLIVDEWREPDGKPPSNRLVEEMADGILDLGYHNLQAIVGDPAGDARNDKEHETSARTLQRRLGGIPFRYPIGRQRLKASGETVVAGRVCAANGTRSLLWASDGERDRVGSLQPRAANSYRDHQQLRYPDRRLGEQAAPTESLKDGIADHGTDAVRYYLVVVRGGSAMGDLTAGRIAGAA